MHVTDHLFESVPRRQAAAAEDYPAVVADVLSLLDSAERAGLRSGRAMRLRAKLERGLVLDAERVSAVEQWLRDWLAHRQGAAGFDGRTPSVTA